MKANSVKFKGNACFKSDWVGFDEIKPVNVVIGRNNSGKSQLLDLIEILCGKTVKSNDWKLLCNGLLDEQSLRSAFPENTSGGVLGGNFWRDHGKRLIGTEVKWEVAGKSGVTNVEVTRNGPPSSRFGRASDNARLEAIGSLVTNANHHLTKSVFRRLRADRDIRPERESTDLMLDDDGTGATNITRRFLLSSKSSLTRETINIELRNALNEIFGNDGAFSEIQVVVHDDSHENGTNLWEICLGEDSKGLIPLSRSGSGLKTVLLVLLNLLVVPKMESRSHSDYTFAFEELENNLHPTLLRRLFVYLESFATETGANIFLTTHSSTALDVFGMSPSAQIVHVVHDGESARTTTIAAHFDQLNVVAELGAKPSDLLQANGVVWVEGPSDRVYLNHWIEIYSRGKLREGRDYQCAYYGGALLARTQFKAIDGDVDPSFANLLRVNPNVIVICDGDRRAKGARVKARVRRIRSEVSKIPNAYIWVTAAKEIENYLPGTVLAAALGLSSLPDPEQYQYFFPRKGARTMSYVDGTINRKGIDKVELAMACAEHVSIEVMSSRFDWENEMGNIVGRIRWWND